PGDLPLVVTADVDGRQQAFERTVAVTLGRYPDLAGAADVAAVADVAVTPAAAPDPQQVAGERRALAAALAGIGPQRRWTLPLLAPVPGEIAVPYGTRRDAAAGPHRLADILAAAGEPVRAAAAGTVTLAAEHRFSGRTVAIDHGLGLCTLYFHLSETRVTQGQTVERGQVIGLAGASGSAAGPLLGFGAAVLGRLVDPEPLLGGPADTLTGE
ncbi:MAG: M23 family metallopeptidase, partial [Desulfovibrionaceae bacterium]